MSKAAAEIGRLGGLARARNIGDERRREIARQGAAARWGDSKEFTLLKTNGAPAEISIHDVASTFAQQIAMLGTRALFFDGADGRCWDSPSADAGVEATRQWLIGVYDARAAVTLIAGDIRAALAA